MNRYATSSLSVVLLLLVSAAGYAAQPDPMDANAEVPAVKYRPILGDYQPYREARIGSWHRLNVEVAPNATGGEPAVGQPAQAPEAPAPHAGHHMDDKE